MAGIEALTVAALSSALDAASLRQQVIATNIANAGRSDYVAQRVSFEATLAEQAARLHGEGVDRRPPVELRMRVEPDLDADGRGRPVQLDAEVGALAQNSTHYQALIRGLNRYLSVMASAVSEGKR